MTIDQGLIDQIEEFKSKSKGALGIFQRFEQGCPLRLRVNVYSGCTFNCKFCYISQKARPDRKVLRHLSHDMKLAASMGFAKLPVMVSCSSDPFQPWEAKVHHTEKVLRKLAEGDYRIIIMTQNPGALLENRYLDSLMQVPSVVEVTIPSLNAGPGAEGIFKSLAPPAENRYESMEALKEKGISVRLRLAPVIPVLNRNGPGQSEDEIWKIIERAHDVGVQMVIANIMVLTPTVEMSIWRLLGKYYIDDNALWTKRDSQPEYDMHKFTLKAKTVERLLMPVCEACTAFSIPFCPCVSRNSFPQGNSCVL